MEACAESRNFLASRWKYLVRCACGYYRRAGRGGGVNRLRQLRTDALLTVEELAEATGVPVNTIYNIEAGRVARPKMSTLEPLAQHFGVPASQFVASSEVPA